MQTTALLIKDDRVKTIYVMPNPSKFKHIERVIH